MRLIEACHIHHLALRDIVLLHVSFDHTGRTPRVLPEETGNIKHNYNKLILFDGIISLSHILIVGFASFTFMIVDL